MRKEKGSITIFSVISLVLISSAIFALLEGTRLQELYRFADLQTELALEGVFANYNHPLWENYHLLGTSFHTVNEVLETGASGRVGGGGTNLLRLKPEEYEMESYTRFTDADGRVFIKSVSAYMKDHLLYESAKEIYNRYEAVKNIKDSQEVDLSKIGEAIREVENADAEATPKSKGTAGTQNSQSKQDVITILEEAKRWQEAGILELVIEDSSKISKLECDLSGGVLERELEVGKEFLVKEIEWTDRILLQQYLLTYMSNYRDTKTNRALSYEIEYLLGGKDADTENMKIVVTELLAIREAANLLYLVSNPQMSARAEGMATLIAGASLNPIIIKAVKMGLLTAWAFAESICDVRALLAGKRIALMKSDMTWTTELDNLGQFSQKYVMAKESKWGLTYEEYLGILLLFKNEQNLAMQTMQIQEAAIRNISSDESFRMDTLITQAEVYINYSYDVVFPFLPILDVNGRWENKIPAKKNYGYH